MRKPVRSRGYGALLAVLVETRREAGITQRQLAERLKVPRSVVSKTETGERRIDPMEAYEWAKACGADAMEFFIRFVRAVERRP